MWMTKRRSTHSIDRYLEPNVSSTYKFTAAAIVIIVLTIHSSVSSPTYIARCPQLPSPLHECEREQSMETWRVFGLRFGTSSHEHGSPCPNWRPV